MAPFLSFFFFFNCKEFISVIVVGPISFWYLNYRVLDTTTRYQRLHEKTSQRKTRFLQWAKASYKSCYVSPRKRFHPLPFRPVEDRLRYRMSHLCNTSGSLVYNSNTKFNSKKIVKTLWLTAVKWSTYNNTKPCELSIWGFQLLLPANLSFLSCIEVQKYTRIYIYIYVFPRI